MLPYFTLGALLSIILAVAVMAEDKFTVAEAAISTDDKRQQAILGVKELRRSYALPIGPEFAQVIVETYGYGELLRRFRGAHAPNFGRNTGTVSLAWISKEREMVSIIENGHPCGPFSKCQLIDNEDFDEPFDPWFFRKSEKNEDMIPLFGIWGRRGGKMGPRDGKRDFVPAAAFTAACNASGARYCWVVYLHIGEDNSGGWPAFKDEK